jgi:hypothetical protein
MSHHLSQTSTDFDPLEVGNRRDASVSSCIVFALLVFYLVAACGYRWTAYEKYSEHCSIRYIGGTRTKVKLFFHNNLYADRHQQSTAILIKYIVNYTDRADAVISNMPSRPFSQLDAAQTRLYNSSMHGVVYSAL